MANDINITVGLQGEQELRQSLSEINDGLRVNKSEMELVTAEYGKNATSIEALTAKGDVLQKIIASQTDKVQKLSDALAKEARINGESTKFAMKKQAELNKAKAELIGYTQELEGNNAALAEANAAYVNTGSALNSLSGIVSDCDSRLKLHQSELSLIKAEYGAIADSTEIASRSIGTYNKIIDAQKEKVQALESALAEMRKKEGEGSQAVRELAASCNKAKAELATYSNALNDATTELYRAEEAASDAAKEVVNLDNIITDCNDRIQLHKSELELVAARYKDSADGAAYAKKSAEALNKMVEAQKDKCRALRSALEELAQTEGENSQSVRKLATDYNKAKAQLKDYEKQTKDATDGTGKFTKSAKKAGNEARGSTKGIDAMTVALGDLVAKGIEKVISGLIDLTQKMQDYNRDMSKLEQNARSAGVGMRDVEQAMKDLNFITGETDSNIEALSNLMQAGFKDNNLGKAVEALSGAVIKFPDTLKIESLADSLQETLATGEATGQFAEMLGRLGIEVEKFDSGLQRAAKTGRDQEYVLNILAKSGLPQVAQEYTRVNKKQKEYADAQYELTQTTAKIAEDMVPVMTKVTKEINMLLEEHSEEIQNLISLISAVAEIILNIIAILAIIPAPVWVVIGGVLAVVAAIMKLSKMFDGAKTALKAFTEHMSPAKFQMMQIMGIALALASVLALLAMLFLAIKEGSEKATAAMERMQNIQINPPEVKTPNIRNAYAKGTFSAANGWALVGEEGPELVAFSGGERVYNAQKTRSMLAAGGSSGTGVQIGTLNVYPNKEQWNQLMGLFEQSRRAGHDRRKR